MNALTHTTKELTDICERIADPQEEGDPYIRMFAKSLGGAILRDPNIALKIGESMIYKQVSGPYPASYAFNSLLRLFQMDHIDEPEYPYESGTDWESGVRDWLTDPKQLDLTSYNMRLWNVGSDVETRAAGPKLVMELLKNGEDGEPYTILSVGSARDHGLAQLSLNEGFDEVQICEAAFADPEANAFFDECVQKLLNRCTEIGDCYGVDFWPLRDPEWSKFLEACRYKPAELKYDRNRSRYKRLETVRDEDPRFHHFQGDFADTLDGWMPGMKKDQLMDMIIFSTSLYQNYPEKRRAMIDKARARLKDSGVIVVQDFCVDNESPESDHMIDGFDFPGPDSPPYTYTTMVFDNAAPEKGIQKLVSWKNGRCNIYRPHETAIDLVASEFPSAA